MPRRIDLDEAAFRDLWLAGVPLREISARFNLGADTLGGVRRRLRLPPRTAETRPKARANAIDDPTPDQIAERAAEVRARWDEATRIKRRGGLEDHGGETMPDAIFDEPIEDPME